MPSSVAAAVAVAELRADPHPSSHAGAAALPSPLSRGARVGTLEAVIKPAFLRVRSIERVRLHADITRLGRLGLALADLRVAALYTG